MAESLASFLTRRIGDEIALLRDFVVVLQREQDALAQDDAEGINASLEQKTRLTQELGQISAEWNLALVRAGYTANRQGLEQLISQQHGAAALARARDELFALARKANELNTLNGSLIRTRMRHNQQALAILLGNGEATPLYGRDGSAALATTGATGRRFYQT